MVEAAVAAGSPRAIRVDPVLVTVGALAFGAGAVVAMGATLVAAFTALGVLAPRLSRCALLCAAVSLAVGWGRASWALAGFEAQSMAARELSRGSSRCALVGRIVSSPAQRGGRLSFDTEVEMLDCEGRIAVSPFRVRLYAEPAPLARGDVVSAIAELGPVGTFRNFDLPDPRPSAARRQAVLSGSALHLEVQARSWSPAALIDRARAHVRARIEATFSSEVKGMARALVLGENDLEAADTLAFQRSGLSHLLAVSGTHLIFAVLSLVRVLQALLLRFEALSARWDVQRYAAALGLGLAPAYADFAGGSGSAWRAAWMLVAVLGARALGRHVYPSRILSASLALGWLDDGLVVFDPSFLLSLAATTGLICVGGELAQRDAKVSALIELTQVNAPSLVHLSRLLSRAALTTLAATLPCVPILLLIAPGITLASVGANLIAGPLGELVALPLCLAHALLAPLPVLEEGVALVASGALALIRGFAHASASAESLYFEVPPPARAHFVMLTISAAAWIAVRGQRWDEPTRRCGPSARAGSWGCAAWCALGLLVVEAAVRLRHAPGSAGQRRLKITVLDVAQGDAALVDLPDGRLMLVDAGGFVGSSVDPGERVIVPTLRARRRSNLDIVVVTHPHPDHFGGLRAVADAVSIGELWYGGRTESGELTRLLQRIEHSGVRLRTALELCGAELGRAGYSLQLLSPCPDVARDQSANDNSLVLRLTLKRRTALLMGDAERWAEARLLEHHGSSLAADFLKVGHHGSRSSSTGAFIEAVHPALAAISCGARNRFGHPHPETLQTLTRAGSVALRLDLSGAIQWETDGAEHGYRRWAGEQSASW